VFRRFLIAAIACGAMSAQALPIVFTSSSFDTTAVAVAQNIADFHSDSTPSSPLPLLSTATAIGSSDFATAAALGTNGLLTSLAEADSVVGLTDAVGQSHFLGSFLGNGLLTLHLGFDSFNSIVGGGSATGSLFVLFTNRVGATTTTLFNNVFTAGGPINLQFVLPAGGVSSLDLTLVSEASSTSAGQSAQNFAQLTFSGDLPLPSTWLLLMVALVAMAFVQARSQDHRG
jgi:hypothetical protein